MEASKCRVLRLKESEDEQVLYNVLWQLTVISVTALLNATAEAASDNRELTWVFHQTIAP